MSWIEVTYHLRGRPEDAAARAQAIAIEQSIEMPPEIVTASFVRDAVLGRPVAVETLGPERQALHVRLSAETVGDDAGQLLNMLFGNSSLHDDLSVAAVDLPEDLARRIGGGPRLGLVGLRDRVGAHGRALTCSALKPQGLPPDDFARLAADFALGGIDYIKDDHGLADQAYSPFDRRVPACAAGVRQAAVRTGHPTRYVPSLSGNLDQLRRQLRIVAEEGLDTAMVAPSLLGLSNVQALCRDYPDIAFLAHPSFSGAARIAPACLAGLWRLIGLDAIIFPNHGGRFGYSSENCRAIAEAAAAPDRALLPAAPVPAGGMSVARVPEMLAFYGRDVMLLIGGNLLAAGAELTAATAAFVAEVRDRELANV